MSHMQKIFERDWSPELIEKSADGRYKRTVVNAAWVQWQIAWEGGRESMRQEAMKAADDQWVKDPRVSASDAIKAIV